MLFRNIALLSLVAVSTEAFTTQRPTFAVSRTSAIKALTVDNTEDKIRQDLMKELNYQPGQGSGEIAKRFGDLSGSKVKTVGEAFAEFTEYLGFTVNALYKNMITDLVGTTHLIVVNARFQRDAIWCFGILKSLNLVMKNYPETDIGEKLYEAFFKSMDMEYADVKMEAAKVEEWVAGKTKEDVETALSGQGAGIIADIAKSAKGDDLWMYSRYFSIGLVGIMEEVGVEMDKEVAYNVLEDWMTNKLGKPHVTPCADGDLFFKAKDKLDMMETMMKEIEIREKKRMAERLETKADAALKAAEDAEAKAAEVPKEDAEAKADEVPKEEETKEEEEPISA